MEKFNNEECRLLGVQIENNNLKILQAELSLEILLCDTAYKAFMDLPTIEGEILTKVSLRRVRQAFIKLEEYKRSIGE